MTEDPSRRQRALTWAKDMIVIWSAGIGFTTSLFGLGWYFAADEIAEQVRIFLGIDDLATSQEIAELQAVISTLHRRIDEVTGEDGLVVVRLGQSFVVDPVHVGDLVTVRYLMRRTERARDCVFKKSTPLFRDFSGIALPGEAVTPPIQIGTSFRRVQVSFKPPDELLTGRVELSVTLQYECDGRTDFDEIEALAFQLLPPT